jgi:hypothetical protein
MKPKTPATTPIPVLPPLADTQADGGASLGGKLPGQHPTASADTPPAPERPVVYQDERGLVEKDGL